MKVFKIISAVLILLFMVLFFRATDMQQVVSSVSRVGFGFFYLLLITFTAYLFATLGWKYCMGSRGAHLSLKDLFLIRHTGEMVSIINPASVIGGEAVKIYLLQNRGVEKATVIASVLIARVMMAVTQLLLFFITLSLLIAYDHEFLYRLPPVSLPLSGLLILAGLVFIFLKSNGPFRSGLKKSRMGKLLNRFSDQWQLGQIWTEFRLIFSHNKKGLLLCTFFFVLHWIAGSMEIYLILKFLGISTRVVQVLFMDMGIILFKAAGAFVPGQLGVEELGNKVMLDLIGIPQAGIWITVSILRRARQLFWLIFGFAAYLIFYKKGNTSPQII